MKPDYGMMLRSFFLGAGFMLVETKAVVQMALLFGGTWMVNTVGVRRDPGDEPRWATCTRGR